MNTHLDQRRDKLDKLISRKYEVSCMSNSKWVKLIDNLINNHELISEIKLKLVWDENIRELLLDEFTSKDFDYYPTSMEGMVTGAPRGWYEYKEIEWIEFTENARELEEMLNGVAKFDLLRINDNLRLIAYK